MHMHITWLLLAKKLSNPVKLLRHHKRSFEMPGRPASYIGSYQMTIISPPVNQNEEIDERCQIIQNILGNFTKYSSFKEV